MNLKKSDEEFILRDAIHKRLKKSRNECVIKVRLNQMIRILFRDHPEEVINNIVNT